MPDSIVVTDKRLVFCIPGNLGLTTNFEIFAWRDIKEVSFKEEFFGAKFTAVPAKGENFTVDYIPKVQARKLFQFSNQQLDRVKDQLKQEQQEKEAKQVIPEVPVQPGIEGPSVPVPDPVPAVVPAFAAVEAPEDELTQKLKKLKVLFEKQLITQEEYEAKKADILSNF